MKKKILYKKGELINGIVFIEDLPYKKNREAVFLCNQCSERMIARVDNVKAGVKKRCSKCIGSKTLLKKNKPRLRRKKGTLEPLKSKIITKIKKRAIAKNLEFDLSDDFIMNLVVKNCFYCGAKPNQIKKNSNFKILHHGLDRMDNSLGYVKDNVCSCCVTCNKGKSNLSLTEWNEYLNNLVLYINKRDNNQT